MNKEDRTFTDRKRIADIINRATVCRIGLIVDGAPHIIPMNFGFCDPYLYFHTSPKSAKLEQLRNSPAVCVELDIEHELQTAALPCGWTMRYESVIGRGTAEIVSDAAEMRNGFDAIMAQYGGTADGIPEKTLDGVAIIRIHLTGLTGRTNIRQPEQEPGDNDHD